MKPRFFPTRAAFRAWLETHHEKAKELSVGFYRATSGKPSITWPEAVEEALCFGWIDGVRHKLDEISYTNRFTPRRPTSNWSAINVAKVKQLLAEGRMTPAGLRAYELRTPEKTGVYSFERNEAARLEPADEKRLRSNKKAAAFFDAQAPWYRRTTTHWVVSAKRPETRRKRLDQLIACCAAGEPIPQLDRRPRAAKPKK
jgi:uncharacterized protein YdeI (YjbR/CyaY-like superfamily)